MSAPEDEFALQLKGVKLDKIYQRELVFAKDFGRKWRFDFADPDQLIAVEIEGGVGRFKTKRPETGALGDRMSASEYQRLMSSGEHSRPRISHMDHTSLEGFENDGRKYLTAACMGWIVIRVTPRQVTSGEALQALESVISIRLGQANPELKIDAGALPWIQTRLPFPGSRL